MKLRQKTNEQLFSLYDAELVCRHRSEKGLGEARRFLSHFYDFLGQFPPSVELAKKFLSQFANRRPKTFARYVSEVNGFLTWYGEKLDLKVKIARPLPQYVKDDDVDILKEAMKGKRTHKKSILRDVLLVDFAYKTGLRRTEISNLEIRDINLDGRFVTVRHGKGDKARIVPITIEITARLRSYLYGKNPHDSVFGLKPASITNKISVFAKKSGIDIHAHSLRHGCATRLLESGANIKVVQEILGHSKLDTTERYLSLTSAQLREAVDRLDEVDAEPVKMPLEATPDQEGHLMSWELAEAEGNLKQEYETKINKLKQDSINNAIELSSTSD